MHYDTTSCLYLVSSSITIKCQHRSDHQDNANQDVVSSVMFGYHDSYSVCRFWVRVHTMSN